MPYASLDARGMTSQSRDQPVTLCRLVIGRSCPARVPDSGRLIRTSCREYGIVVGPLDVVDGIGMRGEQARFWTSFVFLVTDLLVTSPGCRPDSPPGLPTFRDARVALFGIKNPHSAAFGRDSGKTVFGTAPCILCRMRECASVCWGPVAVGADELVWIGLDPIDVE